MLQIIFKETVSLFTFVFQTLNFIWIGFIAFLDWFSPVSHQILKSNEIWVKLGLFFASLFFSPLPLWTSFIFIFLPPMWTAIVFTIFCFMFVVSLSFGFIFF